MSDKYAAAVEALRRRKPARMPEMDIEGRMPQPARIVPVDVPPEFQAQEQAMKAPPMDPLHEEQAAMQAQPPPIPAPFVPPEDDSELNAAREADRQSRFTAGMELAGRQLVSGITRTPVGQSLGANPSEVPAAMERAKSRRQQVMDAIARARQGRMDEATLAENKSQAELRSAQAAKLLREKATDGAELTAYKAGLLKRYPDQKELIDGLPTMKAAQDFQNSFDSELGRKTTIEAAQIAAGTARAEAGKVRDAAKADKATETEAEQAIPGHIHDPKIKVPPTKVSALRDGIADAATIQGLIGELDALVAKHGLEVLPGPVKTRMEALVKQLDVKAKGPAFAELGVLAGPDLAMLDAMIGDPTNWQTVFKGGAADVRARLDVFRNTVKTNLGNKKRLYGYSEAGGSDASATSAKPSPGPGYVRGKAGGKAGWYNAEKNDWVGD